MASSTASHRNRADGDQHNGHNKGNAGSVDAKARHAPERHSDVSKPKKNKDEIGHCRTCSEEGGESSSRAAIVVVVA